MHLIDSFLFGSFLLLNLVVGLRYGRGVKSLRQYALGDKNFSTWVITLTIVATWLSGTAFTYALKIFYAEGLIAIIKFACRGLSLCLISFFMALRSKAFLSHLSIAESMGTLYGPQVRLITALVSLAFNSCIVAAQFSVGGEVLGALLGLDSAYAGAFVALIVVTYACLGGMRAVTFTDALQFFFFGLFVPLLLLLVGYTWLSSATPQAATFLWMPRSVKALGAKSSWPLFFVGVLLSIVF